MKKKDVSCLYDIKLMKFQETGIGFSAGAEIFGTEIISSG